MGQQRVDEGPVPIAGSRMHHQARGFIQHDDIAVFVQNRERDRLRLGRRRYRFGNPQRVDSAGANRFGWLGDRFAVARQRTILYQCLDAGPGNRADRGRQHPVDSLTRLLA
jgi:hypothetical protein